MNFKSAASTIICKIFGTISFLGFLIALCVADVPRGQIHIYLYFILFCIASGIIAVFASNKNIILRHLSAILHVFLLCFGLTFKVKSNYFRRIYAVAVRTNSLKSFYLVCLSKYDLQNGVK